MGEAFIVNRNIATNDEVTSVKELPYISRNNGIYTYDVSSVNNEDIKYIVFETSAKPSTGYPGLAIYLPNGNKIYDSYSHTVAMELNEDELKITLSSDTIYIAVMNALCSEV